MAKKDLDLADILAGELNKSAKDQKVAFFLDSDEAPTNVEGWISTGCAMLDVAISNRPYGGLPVGRITEVTGLEQSGKSLLSAHLLAETQKQGGVAVLIDTETAVSREFLEAIGVDVSKLLYVSADSVEQIFDFTETIIEKVRQTSRDKLVTIVVDFKICCSQWRSHSVLNYLTSHFHTYNLIQSIHFHFDLTHTL